MTWQHGILVALFLVCGWICIWPIVRTGLVVTTALAGIGLWAISVWDSYDSRDLFISGCMLAIGLRALWSVRHRVKSKRPMRRVTDWAELDAPTNGYRQRGRAGIAHIVVALFVGIFFAMVYGTARADPAPCEFRTDLGYAKGYSDGCLWAGWVCAPKDEWSDYTLGRSVVEIAALPGMLLTMADGSHADLLAMRTRQLVEMACFTPAVRERIEALRPLSRWVTASNAGRDSRPVYHALPGEQLGAQYASNVAVSPVGWPCDPSSLRAVKGASVYGRPKGWRGDMVTLCRLR